MDDLVGLPKSERVARALERDIRQGRVAHGDLLESEGGLMQRFSVSRNTVRRGLGMLARRGLITTRTGVGSFVTYGGTTIDSNLGWTLALSEGPGRIETRTLDVSRGGCARSDAFLGSRGDYLCVDRLRFCLDAGTGISLERSRLPWREGFAAILETLLSGGSLNRALLDLGLRAASGEEVAGVVPALSRMDAVIMDRAPGRPMLRVQRVTRADDGTVVEYVDSILDPGRFGLRIAF